MQKTWRILDPAPESFLADHPELPPTVANLLYHRKVTTQEKIDEFLNPDYLQDIHDPYLFRDMDKAVERIFKAIENKEKIIVHGDYDADGVSASVILISILKALGATDIDVFLPHREIDGYGLNKYTIQVLAQQKANLIITCDCGVSNREEVETANQNNIDVIITDHHGIPEQLPPAYAIIHPLIPGETYPDKGLCGGGVAFKLAQALLKKRQPENKEGWEKWLLDLVAIATVADMVPLFGESRTLTKYGLVVLNKTKRIGLQKLLLEARLAEEDGTKKRELDTHNIGFHIAPRLNAAGRMNHANTAYNLLITDEPTEAADLAYQLNQNNSERQKLTDELLKIAIDQTEKEQKDAPVLFILGKNWPTGIVGLIAGKIKDRYYKPTLVISHQENEWIGSGRSIEEFNLIAAMREMPEVFAKFGGHPMACGFTLRDEGALAEFRQKLTDKFLIATAGLDLRSTLLIDAKINLDEIDWGLYDMLEKFEPFGQGNEKPKYLAENLEIYSLEPVGQEGKHLRVMVKTPTGKIRKTIGWSLCNGNGNGTNWCKKLKPGDKIDIIFEIGLNEWNGNRELQLTICDLKMTCDTDTRINADDADNADDDETDLIYSDLTYKINGLLFEVHNELGRYCNEKQICDAIEQKLIKEKIPYKREMVLPPSFAGERIGRNRIDFLIEEKIILEVKTMRFTGKEEYYQCLRYLEALNLKLCILVNFRDKHLKTKRVLNPKAKI
ncbi:MAG: single-stranded-DNA-specific exonuclease RecJ [Candidatus Magasanikbacteria bacterium]|nr:single-stranded-DNA-specific exonuclease RecJ [Candidatus Magasanikbacteria bacterium]